MNCSTRMGRTFVHVASWVVGLGLAVSLAACMANSPGAQSPAAETAKLDRPMVRDGRDVCVTQTTEAANRDQTQCPERPNSGPTCAGNSRVEAQEGR